MAAFDEVVTSGHGQVAATLQAFYTMLGPSDMLAYLAYMAPRLIELRRVLKDTGSIYLHCDPTASHYLKLSLDAVFGVDHFRNEIIWKRSHAHSSAKRFGPIHDVILFYSKTQKPLWNPTFQEYDAQYIEKHYRHIDELGRRYKHENPTGAGTRKGETGKPWRGIDPTPKGRHWMRPPSELDKLDEEGLIYWPKKAGSWPYIKVYLDEMLGAAAQDVWTDINVINMMAKERLGYPTQKPVALLERIVQASSNEGDVVLDPFCGCGTAIAAAQQLNRRWVGIDITHLAITLIKHRLHNAYGKEVDFKVMGEPEDMAGARELGRSDPYQFQWWALGLVDARPVEQKKGADQGVDGRLYFRDDPKGPLNQIVISVKAGVTGPAHVRDLRGVVEREKAAIGLLITMQEPTAKMRAEAAEAGVYASPGGTRHPRLQLRTVEELMAGAVLDYPRYADNVTFKKAARVKGKGHTNGELFD